MTNRKMNRAALFLEVDGKLHQAILTDVEMTILLNIAAAMHEGSIKVTDKPVETIAFEDRGSK